MALVSPGVEVQVIDESFYTPAGAGTVPLIVVASAENKLNGAGTAIAAGTLAANVGKVFRITSQRELVETFGVPFFEKTASSSPVHGSERNEYGLLAAYSALGVTNSAFIMRASVDLNDLAPDTTEPGAAPKNGTWWINTGATSWGIQEWNSEPTATIGGQKFTTKTPIVLTDADSNNLDGVMPKMSVGTIGDYAVVYRTTKGSGSFSQESELARIYFKSPGNMGAGIEPGQWVLLGSNQWCQSWPVVQSSSAVTQLTDGGTFYINDTLITVPGGATVTDRLNGVVTAINSAFAMQESSVTAVAQRGRLVIYSSGATSENNDSTLSGMITITSGTADVAEELRIVEGMYLQPKLEHGSHVQRPLFKRTEQPSSVVGYPTGSVWIKTTEPNLGARMRVSKWNSDTGSWVAFEAPFYANGHSAIASLDRSGGGANIAIDTLYTQYNATENYSYRAPSTTSGYDQSLETAEFRVWRRRAVGETVAISAQVIDGTFPAGTASFSLSQSYLGGSGLSAQATVSVMLTGTPEDASIIAAAINAVTFVDTNGNPITNNVVAAVSDNDQLILRHKLGGDIRFTNGLGSVLANIFTPFKIEDGTGTMNFYNVRSEVATGATDDYLVSNWAPLAASIRPMYEVSSTEPLAEPDEGQMWYNPNFSDVDIMVHNGNTWVGYRNQYGGYPNTDAQGPQVSASMPETQSDGTDLVDGDLWISTADLENFPTIYRYNGDLLEWVLIDKTDQTTEEGILFMDARYSTSGDTNAPASIADLLVSNYLDPDAPDPALYPKGMMLYNTRRSYGNVKQYISNYINPNEDNPRYKSSEADLGMAWVSGESMADYVTARWVTASPNNEDGSGTFGRHAQRAVVVQRLKSVIDTSEEVRDEERRNFNLISCPGYPETLSNLVNLNLDRKVTAFVVGDTPLRLKPNATSISTWASNANLAFDNGDQGLVTYDEYTALWYPNGFTTDLSGVNAVVPASHMMLKTIILSDQVSYPWFAPAGTRRGGITNATSVGYIDPQTGEFNTVALNEGQRDTLYENKLNPIPFFDGVGLVAYGQKTRARNASALDRINVARLVVYLRRQLTKLARPFLFEPNDQITRDEVKAAVDSLMLELVALRAIYDYVVVCDESNNTPARVDRNELWVDLAISPVKAVEFIYIPLRIKNTGEL